MSVLNIVKGSPLFYEIYDEEIMKIVDHCEVRHLAPDDYVFKEGEEGDELFILLVGSAIITRDGIELATLKKGDLFGEMVLLNENIRLADIKSTNFSDVLVLKYSDIFDLYKSDTKIFSILMLNMARMLSKRLKGAGDVIKELKSK